LSAERSPFAARTIVREDDEDGVVEDSVLLETRDQSAQLVIGVRQKARGNLHLACHQFLLAIAMIVPGADARVRSRKDGIPGHDGQALLVIERLGSNHVPASVEFSAIRYAPLACDVMWNVQRAESKIRKKWAAG